MASNFPNKWYNHSMHIILIENAFLKKSPHWTNVEIEKQNNYSVQFKQTIRQSSCLLNSFRNWYNVSMKTAIELAVDEGINSH